MRLLMLSTDQSVFTEGSATRSRLIDYARLIEEIHVIVYTPRSSGKRVEKINNKIFLYPTNTRFKPCYFWDAYRIGKKIINDLRLTKHDSVITTQDPFETALVGYLLKRQYKIPLQIQSHSDFLSPFFAAESLKNRLRVVLGKWLIKKADGIRVVSNRVKNSLITNCQLPGNRIAVLPIIYDMDRFRYQPITADLHKKYPNHDFIILVASRFTVEKNIGLAIEAMRKVVERYPKALLLLVGDGPERDNIQLLITSYQLQDNVVIEPWTSDLVSYYRTADLFVLTSNYEGGARAPAEAVAAGLPVVMTDVAPAGEIVQDDRNGYVVPVGDSDLLAKKLSDLISDAATRERFRAESAKISATLISREEYIRRYVAALQSL